jgi:hypothetical protein
MKNSITLLFTLFIFNCITAQVFQLDVSPITSKYSYSEVMYCDSTISDTAIYYKIKEWASTQTFNLNRLKDDKVGQKEDAKLLLGWDYANFTAIDLQYKNKTPIKQEIFESKKIILTGVYKYTSRLMSCLQTSYTNYDVIIQIKKGRIKVTYTNYSIDMYYSNNAMPLESSGITLENLIDKDLGGNPCKKRLGEYTVALQLHCSNLNKELRTFVSEIKRLDEDKW